ncbi:MAG TPA: MFS transporter [Thermoplasmata archaeon]|nr:MFS transporter [Thermoplasmata archaeon]
MERSIRWMGLGGIIRATGVSLVLPFLVLYLRRVLDLGYTEIGVLVALTGVVPLLIVPFAGLLTDRIGRRRLFLLSLAGEAGSFLALAGAMRLESLVGVLVLATTVQIVGTIGGPALSAYVADFTEGSDRTMGFTWLRIGWNVGFTIGVLAGGVLIGFVGFVWVAFGAGVVLLGSTSLLAAVLDPSPYDRRRAAAASVGARVEPTAAPSASVRRSLEILARDRPFLALCAVVALSELTIGQWATIFPLYVNTVLGLPYALLGAGFALNGLIVVFGQAPMTRAAAGRRHTSLFVGGVAAYAVGFFLFGVVGQYSLFLVPMFFAVVFVLTIGENLTSIPMSTLPSNLAPPTEIGAYNGAFFALIGIGQLLAPAVGGAVVATGAAPLAVWSALVAPSVPAGLILALYVTPRLRDAPNRA